MNRFRTKKRGKDGSEISGRPSPDSDVQVPKLKSSMTFRRGKKEPEPKVELDLANALPSSDDFRTSLLMSGLSARFSMLREQDDPKSKLGKASDDSVLFPKRQSQLLNFGYQSSGLADIAEVASIRSGPRPPFLFGDRADSYVSVDGGYGTDDGGSMMGRAKPGEGNNLFGGRQKIYKIPIGASTSLKNVSGEGDFKMGGRALYEDDVSQSAFQRLREREREQERLRIQRERDDDREAVHTILQRSNSPPPSGYNRDRETSSTISSGPVASLTRSSTAATSVTSQFNGYSTPSTPAIPIQGNSGGADRQTTKMKRLYETGLDRDLHFQQHSAMNRLENLSKSRNALGRSPSPAPGSPSARDTAVVNGFGGYQEDHRSESPPLLASRAPGFDYPTKQIPSAIQKPHVAPPLSPPFSDGDDPTNLVIQPNDRGKATALGAFSKPIQPYDEDKYTQRQLQMQQERDGCETPPLRRRSPHRTFLHSATARPRAESNSTYASSRSGSSSSAKSQLETRNRGFTSRQGTNEAPAAESHPSSKETFLASPDESFINLKASVHAPPASVEVPQAETEEQSKVHTITNPPNPMQDRWAQIRKNAAATERSKLQQLAASQRQPEHMNRHKPGPHLIRERPPESQHPANRSESQRLWVDYTEELPSETAPVSRLVERLSIDYEPPEDSPTLGPGLSGLVRQHLRSESNESTVPGRTRGLGLGSGSLLQTSVYSNSGDNLDSEVGWNQGLANHSNVINKNEPFDRRDGTPKDSPILLKVGKHSSLAEQEKYKASWEKDLEVHHTRAGSSETQKERDDFASELASRRKLVQDNMKSKNFDDGEDNLQKPAGDWSKETMSSRSNPIGSLRSKISRESFGYKPITGSSSQSPPIGNQSKAMKMLGLSSSAINGASSPNPRTEDDERLWRQEEDEVARGIPKSPRAPPGTRNYRQARRDAQRNLEREVRMRHTNRAGPDSGELQGLSNSRLADQHQEQSDRSPSEERFDSEPRLSNNNQEINDKDQRTVQGAQRAPSHGIRDRSSSDASTSRSKSRNGRYRDDLAKAMAEGHGSSAHGGFEDLVGRQGLPNSPAPQAPGSHHSPSHHSPALGASRSRSNSKTGYFEGNQLQPIQTTLMDIGISPRPSPVTPFSVNSTPALVQPSPTLSGANTPMLPGFPAHSGIPQNRKRSVNKSDISEPTLLHKTSDIVTVNLPPGASLSNGSPLSAPPLPAMDPRRRQTRTQTMFDAFTGRHHAGTPPTPSIPSHHAHDETSTFSADEAEKKPRQKLRKSSSEGGNMNAKARQAFDVAPSPAVPTFLMKNNLSTGPIDGGMF